MSALFPVLVFDNTSENKTVLKVTVKVSMSISWISKKHINKKKWISFFHAVSTEMAIWCILTAFWNDTATVHQFFVFCDRSKYRIWKYLYVVFYKTSYLIYIPTLQWHITFVDKHRGFCKLITIHTPRKNWTSVYTYNLINQWNNN